MNIGFGILITAFLVAGIGAVLYAVVVERAFRGGTRAIDAIHDYNKECIKDGTWDRDIYKKALLSFDDRMVWNILIKPDKMSGIKEEYKELLEPYFEKEDV